MYLRYLVEMKQSHFAPECTLSLYDHLHMKRDVKHKIHQVGLQRKQGMFKMSAKGMNTSMQECQLRRQSVTAPSHATHSADMSQLINVMNSGFILTLLNDRPNVLIPWTEV